MTKQEQIDKICEWMGWYWRILHDTTECAEGYERIQWWVKQGKRIVKRKDFDPFTNPSDCARVMDEVVKRGMGYRVIYDPMAETSKWLAGLPRKSYGYSNNSESEAKMNALLEAIGKE